MIGLARPAAILRAIKAFPNKVRTSAAANTRSAMRIIRSIPETASPVKAMMFRSLSVAGKTTSSTLITIDKLHGRVSNGTYAIKKSSPPICTRSIPVPPSNIRAAASPGNSAVRFGLITAPSSIVTIPLIIISPRSLEIKA
jgi:hypothetical protein